MQVAAPDGTSPSVVVLLPGVTANPDAYHVRENGSLVVGPATGLLANDYTSLGSLAAQSFSSPAHGSLGVDADGSFTYTPDAGYSGSDSFTYTVSNGFFSATAVATIQVFHASLAAADDSYVVRAGSTLSPDAAHGLLANDADTGGAISAQSFSSAAHGSLGVNVDGAFTYTPDAGFVGTDSFTYTIGDGAQTATATATITVLDAPPVAAPDYYHVGQNGTLTVDAAHGLLADDFDPDGDAITALSFSSPAHGSLGVDADGSFTYTPEAGYSGSDSFSYTISDGSLSATATATIEVVACYCRGTLITTERGETTVESLTTADRVVTWGGDVRPVRWLGRRRIDLARHTTPQEVCPVRIVAGALGQGVPKRDLLVSPDHAILVGGRLVAARRLLNGASVRRESGLDEADYYHVELEHHDLLVAEGAPAESYLDTGNRAAFENHTPSTDLRSSVSSPQELRERSSCAPFATDPDESAELWRLVAARAEALGLSLSGPAAATDDPDLHIRIADRRIDPVEVGYNRFVFSLPCTRSPARLVSRATRPSDVSPWLDDRRTLGVRVHHLSFGRGGRFVAFPLDGLDVQDGWWNEERDSAGISRWTDGDAALPCSDCTEIEVQIIARMRYPRSVATVAD